MSVPGLNIDSQLLLENIQPISKVLLQSPSLNTALSWGYTYNKVAPKVFETVWSLDLKRPKTDPFDPTHREFLEQANWSLSGQTEVLPYLLNLQSHLDPVVSQVGDRSVQSGLFFSTTGPEKRPHIPVHIHSNIKNSTGETGWTLSFYFKLTEKDRPQKFCFFRDFPKNMLLTESDIEQSFASFSLDSRMGCFLFRADQIPHTVIFSDDIYLWHVTNCIQLKFEVGRLDSTQIYKIA